MSDVDEHLDLTEINAVRRLLTSKPRTVRWDERRARLDEVGSVWPVAEDIRCEDVVFDGLAGEWSLAPGSDRDKVLLFFHGGGYCSGSLKSHRRMVTEAGRAMGMRTLAIDYRRAPEHPFPAQHEDALAAWRFLRRQGIAPDRIVIGGDSAGGNLTLCLVSILRTAGNSARRSRRRGRHQSTSRNLAAYDSRLAGLECGVERRSPHSSERRHVCPRMFVTPAEASASVFQTS